MFNLLSKWAKVYLNTSDEETDFNTSTIRMEEENAYNYDREVLRNKTKMGIVYRKNRISILLRFEGDT